jgi:hypothetical protein
MPVLQRFDFARQLPAGAVTGFKRAFCEAKEGGKTKGTTKVLLVVSAHSPNSMEHCKDKQH